MLKYIMGVVLIGAGVFMVWRTDLMMKMFGYNGWAEEKLGSGGSWTFYKLLGIGFIFISFIVMSGVAVSILDIFFKRG